MERIQPKRMKKLKVNFLKNTDNEIKLEIEGVSHTLFNLLQETLLEDENVGLAGYHIPHPLINSGILYIHTKDKYKPEDVLNKATKKIRALNKDFKKSFKKASKDYK